MRYLGDCTSSFDEKSGNSLIECFDNVSEFAGYEETFRERVEEDEEGFLSVEDFNRIVGENDIVGKDFECYFYIIEV